MSPTPISQSYIPYEVPNDLAFFIHREAPATNTSPWKTKQNVKSLYTKHVRLFRPISSGAIFLSNLYVHYLFDISANYVICTLQFGHNFAKSSSFRHQFHLRTADYVWSKLSESIYTLFFTPVINSSGSVVVIVCVSDRHGPGSNPGAGAMHISNFGSSINLFDVKKLRDRP